MLVSKKWLEELIDLKVPMEEVISLLPLRTIGTKEITDKFIELDMKGYNRADLLSLRGVALEIAAITDSEVKFKETTEYVWDKLNLPDAQAIVQDQDLCPVYCIAKIEGLKVGASSKEWTEKLESSGIRTVNNVADVTNLMMVEFGQPMHAFDIDQVEGQKLIVRRALPDETIVTLDGKKRELLHDDLVIADHQKAVGLAGVMGGQNSEITDSTTTILLEAAIFDAKALRKTAVRLGLQSEASKRFQHGLTKKRLLEALDQAIRMYQDLGGKLTALTLIGDLSDQPKKIILEKAHIDSLIGIKLSEEQIISYLEKLNFKLIPLGRDWEVEVPYFRLDIEIEADVIEEIARMYGYETLPAKELTGEDPEKIDQTKFENIYILKEALVKVGLTEVQLYSFYSTPVINNLNIDRDSIIQIANPISAETEYMQDNLWPNLLNCVAENLKYFPQVGVFQVSKVYIPQDHEMPKEEYRLSLALSGEIDVIEQLYSIFKKVNQELNLGISLGDTKMNNGEQRLFHPTKFFELIREGNRVGQIAEVHPRVVNKFGTEKRVAILEIELT